MGRVIIAVAIGVVLLIALLIAPNSGVFRKIPEPRIVSLPDGSRRVLSLYRRTWTGWWMFSPTGSGGFRADVYGVYLSGSGPNYENPDVFLPMLGKAKSLGSVRLVSPDHVIVDLRIEKPSGEVFPFPENGDIHVPAGRVLVTSVVGDQGWPVAQ